MNKLFTILPSLFPQPYYLIGEISHRKLFHTYMIYITAIDFKMLVSFIFVIGVLQHPNTNKTLPIRNKMAAQKQNSQTNQYSQSVINKNVDYNNKDKITITIKVYSTFQHPFFLFKYRSYMLLIICTSM